MFLHILKIKKIFGFLSIDLSIENRLILVKLSKFTTNT